MNSPKDAGSSRGSASRIIGAGTSSTAGALGGLVPSWDRTWAGKPRGLDLNMVNSRLVDWLKLNISPLEDRPPIRDWDTDVDDRSRTPMDLDPLAAARASEEACYDELVNDGGRQAYPISLLAEISRSSEEHSDKFSALSDMEGNWRVFMIQLHHWKEFRMWQKDNRGIDEEETDFAAHLEAEKQRWARLGEIHQLADFEDEEKVRRKREFWLHDRKQRQQTAREDYGDSGFSGYVEAVKRRLANHGFTKPARLEQDPRHQDALATWIECLNYEYWLGDRYDAEVAQSQPGQQSLDGSATKDMARRQKKFCRWVLEQVPVVEAEMAAERVTVGGLTEACGRKRALSEEDNTGPAPSPKRVKREHRTSSASNSPVAAQAPSRLKRKREEDDVDNEPPAKKARPASINTHRRQQTSSGEQSAEPAGLQEQTVSSRIIILNDDSATEKTAPVGSTREPQQHSPLQGQASVEAASEWEQADDTQRDSVVSVSATGEAGHNNNAPNYQESASRASSGFAITEEEAINLQFEDVEILTLHDDLSSHDSRSTSAMLERENAHEAENEEAHEPEADGVYIKSEDRDIHAYPGDLLSSSSSRSTSLEPEQIREQEAEHERREGTTSIKTEHAATSDRLGDPDSINSSPESREYKQAHELQRQPESESESEEAVRHIKPGIAAINDRLSEASHHSSLSPSSELEERHGQEAEPGSEEEPMVSHSQNAATNSFHDGTSPDDGPSPSPEQVQNGEDEQKAEPEEEAVFNKTESVAINNQLGGASSHNSRASSEPEQQDHKNRSEIKSEHGAEPEPEPEHVDEPSPQPEMKLEPDIESEAEAEVELEAEQDPTPSPEPAPLPQPRRSARLAARHGTHQQSEQAEPNPEELKPRRSARIAATTTASAITQAAEQNPAPAPAAFGRKRGDKQNARQPATARNGFPSNGNSYAIGSGKRTRTTTKKGVSTTENAGSSTNGAGRASKAVKKTSSAGAAANMKRVQTGRVNKSAIINKEGRQGKSNKTRATTQKEASTTANAGSNPSGAGRASEAAKATKKGGSADALANTKRVQTGRVSKYAANKKGRHGKSREKKST